MDVDLKAERIDGTRGVGEVVPHLHSPAVSRVVPLPSGREVPPALLPSVVVQRAAVRRQQGAGFVLDDAVGEELDGVRGQQRRVEVRDTSTRVGEVLELRVEVAGVGVEAEVEPDAERVLPGGVEVGVDVGRLYPGVLHPGHAARQVVLGGGAKCRDSHLRIAFRHQLVHQVDGTPFPQRAQH